ncbi:ABC transporter family substrate-binding protein [Bifidobacterium sp. 6T3]|uniref:ABC transporter family substrate-binding protein n=2 Tax=Bifidobacterium phasiani TaxID=2834431 RepID=A0ABS6W9D9_9BIFI|nr:ABC transporter family substrate-binding protein [Bifidobacterium phasiani]MBW3082366.1 ABC transporter family substrate-binding protein [Bifidobacterium phasiani]
MIAVTAAFAACILALSGCGGNNANTDDTTTDYVQPDDGVPSSYQGTLPTPVAGERNDNPTERDDIQDGGTLTQDISEIGPNWNMNSTDGNTAYMGELWAWYQPHLWDYSVGGEATPNPDYLTNVEVTSEDPLVVTYDINEKAVWNDGTPIDWTAFQATWTCLNGKDDRYNPPQTMGYENIASVEQGETAKQVVVTFETPFYPYQYLFQNLVNPNSVDPDVFTQGWVNDPHTEWAAGPYTIDSFDDTQVTFVRNENWWGNPGKLDKVIFKQMSDSAAINAFQNGEIDAIGGRASGGGASSADRLKIVRGMDGVQLRIGYSMQTNVFTYNGTAGALQDINVRKAISQGFDYDTWISIAYQGVDWNPERPGSEILQPFQEGYENNLPEDVQELDVEGAKKTLEDAGYTMGDEYYEKDGETLHITYTYFGDSATQTAMANAYQQMMKNIGVECEIINLDNSKFSETVTSGSYEVLPMGWSASDPFGYSSSGFQLYGSDSSSNFTYVGSDEVDQLWSIPGTLEDVSAATEAANKAEQASLELYGTIPVSTPPIYMAVKEGLANYGPSGFLQITLHREDIGWEKTAE